MNSSENDNEIDQEGLETANFGSSFQTPGEQQQIKSQAHGKTYEDYLDELLKNDPTGGISVDPTAISKPPT